MMTNREMEMYDYIVETELATAEEINLVRCICSGSWEEILNKVVYARTGEDFDQWVAKLMEEE